MAKIDSQKIMQIKDELYNLKSTFDGNSNSGHYNHLGIPDHHGGSAKSGNVKRATMRRSKEPFTPKPEKYENSKSTWEVIDDIENHLGVTRKKAEEYTQAIKKFTGSWSTEIREVRKKFNKQSYNYKTIKKYADDLDNFIYELPKYDGEVYRGIRVQEDTAKKILNNLQAGKKMDMLGASSWTHNEDVANSFCEVSGWGDAVSMKFVIKQNKTGALISNISAYPNEDEILHPSTSRYVLSEGRDSIKKERKSNGSTIYTVYIEEVDYFDNGKKVEGNKNGKRRSN